LRRQLTLLRVIFRVGIACAAVHLFDGNLRGADTGAVLTGDRQFKTPLASAAQKGYTNAISAARQALATELAVAVKSAMAARDLQEANAIEGLRKNIQGGAFPAEIPTFKTASANQARLRYQQAITTAQKQYGRELQAALKAALGSGDLDDANAIQAELKAAEAMAAVSAPRPLGSATAGRSNEGLIMQRYKMHPSQADGNNRGGYVSLEELQKHQRLGASHVVKTLSKWSKDEKENVIVSGSLRIEKAGMYEFRTASDWDRNALFINGKAVCGFRDGEKKVQAVELPIGLVPIACVGYAHETTWITVQWRPPGQEEFSDIPATLFSR
jgi:hypothetical protein